MTAPQRSRRRILAALVLAIVVAPTVTALCFQLVLLLTLDGSTVSVSDAIGGGFVYLILAVLFGSLLAAIPVLVVGGMTIAVARFIGTRSPVLYAVGGVVGGIFMGWVDAGRTQSVFSIVDTVPFIIGGCASALVYWWVAER